MVLEIIIPTLVVGGLGMLAGAGLGIAAKKFAVRVDPRIEAVLDVLPGANCGGCGYPGCTQLAASIVETGVDPAECPVCNEDGLKQIASIMGIEISLKQRIIARILCDGSCENAPEKLEYKGLPSCRAAVLMVGNTKKCFYGCLGLGSCVQVCPFDALYISKDKLPVVDFEKCTGCGKCVEECPKNIIELSPDDQTMLVLCSSHDKAKAVNKACKVGCTGCSLCKKKCPHDAVTMDKFLAKINWEKCKECGICAGVCVKKTIEDNRIDIKMAEIDNNKCTKCHDCVKACPIKKTITALENEIPKINTSKCVGCGDCVKACPENCISLKSNPEKQFKKLLKAAG